MTFEKDFDDLRLRAAALRRWAVVFALGAVGLFLVAVTVHPGAFGAPYRFHGVQLTFHLDDYFETIGVKGSFDNDRMVLGVRLGAIKGALSIVVWLIVLLGLGYLVRLRWRAALGCFLGAVLVGTLSNGLSLKEGYRSASEDQFGVHLFRPEALQARGMTVPENVIADTRRIQERAAAFRAHAEAAGLEPGGDYLRYTRAQVAYLETDPAMVARMLSAIREDDYLSRRFEPSADVDYRIRIMQEYVEANGLSLAPGAYRPQTGLSFAALRIVSMLLTGLGAAGLVCALVLMELVRTIRRRIPRLQGLAQTLRATTRPAAGGFGRRAPEPASSPA